jgi:hypothetical protein
MNAQLRLLLVILLLLTAPGLRADEEQDLLAVLQSNAAVPAKCAACQRLRLVGTARAVPALAALLGEERTGHAARFALEGLPFPEAGAALRQALGTVSGAAKAGVIDSLGWRHDAAAVPLLGPLVTGPDAMLAAAAAASLGRIAGPEAAAILVAARDRVPTPVRPVVLESLLQCAEGALAAGDSPQAIKLVQDLAAPPTPDAIPAAAWRLMVLGDAPGRGSRVVQALVGQDALLRLAALKIVREVNEPPVVQACLARWNVLGEPGQLAVLEASLKHNAEAAIAVREGVGSSRPSVRVAAWQALGDRGDVTFIPALAKAAATGESAERAAARDTLARLRGEGVREALLQHLASAPPVEQAELLRVLGDRGDAAASKVLLQHAAAGPAAVRVAALESLRKLALAESLVPLLELAAQTGPQTDPEPVLQALFAVCQAREDKDYTARVVIEEMQKASAAGRRRVLPLLSELATPATQDAALAATRDADAELAKDAVRVLGQWPNPAPAPRLLELARTSNDASLQTLALRGFIEVAAQEPRPPARLALMQQALAAAKRPDEKRQALGQIGQIPSAASLQAVLPALEDPALASEAGQAAIAIAEKLAPANAALAADTANRVLAHCKSPDLVKRAWTLRGKPAGSGPFIQDWLVAGPYRQAGANDALTIFNLALGPEKPGEAVAWKPAPREAMVPLSSLFPDQGGCAAYLKTTVTAPQDTDAVLLLASDDGIKAWLNGAVVHANNVDRGAVADQDMVPVRLKAGANELLLKVTQGGGGWAACARLVSPKASPSPA